MTTRNAEEYCNELELVAYGCNRRVYKKLEEKLSELGIHSFTFCEYFPVEPVSLISDFKAGARAKFLFPFARRYNLRPVFPAMVEIDEFNGSWWERITAELRLKKNIADFYKPLEIYMPLTAKGNYKLPFDTPKLIDTLRSIIREKKKKIHSQEPLEVASAEEIYHFDKKDIKKFAKYLKYKYDKAGLDTNQIKKEWLTMDREWWWYLQGDVKKRRAIYYYIPIASNIFLYGILQLTVAMEEFEIPSGPESQTEESKKNIAKKKRKEIEKEIVHLLWEISKEEYLPLLIIFHNYIREKRLKDQLNKRTQLCINQLKDILDDITKNWLPILDDGNKNDLLPLEKAFFDMWDFRKETCNRHATNIAGIKEVIEKTLIMPEYLVASPGMIKQLETALSFQRTSQPAAGAVPCVLIVGGSGTGKEKMAKLVATYAPPFRDALFETFNLAEGFYAHEPHASQRLIERLYEVFKKAKKEGKKSVVLVFDELNSLPTEVQGTLLRFIENKELPPLQDQKLLTYKIPLLEAVLRRTTLPYRPTDYENINKWLRETNVLILGLTNEDPEKLTKVEYIYDVLRSGGGLFAGFLGDFIYEQLRKLRRMREDLYFRMIRNGKIVIPELKKRREDLPILFYSFLKRELGENATLVIEYEAFDELMDERIEWRGNIRELQAICKTVAQLLTKREELKDGGYIVSRFKIRKALRKHNLLED